MATTTPVKGARASRSTIFLKLLMAGSGIIFVLFVLVHMYGNLKAFAGHDSFNAYAEHIRTFGEPMLPHAGLLWVLRIVLILSLVLHVWSATVLTVRSRRARPVKYQMKKNLYSSFSSRTMRWGGVAILVFVIWHLLQFTIVKISVDPDRSGAGVTDDPYNLLTASFDPSVWWMTLIYLLAMLALGMHLHHGTWSAAETLGLTSTERSRVNAKRLGWVVAIVIAGGFSLVPLGVLFGIISK